jgi:hypothetical protein
VELYNLYASQNIVTVNTVKEDEVIRSCTLHLIDEKCIQNFGQENMKGRDHSDDLGIGGRIILEWILQKQSGNLWTGLIWLRIGITSRFL